jgi:hypothetical protein
VTLRGARQGQDRYGTVLHWPAPKSTGGLSL